MKKYIISLCLLLSTASLIATPSIAQDKDSLIDFGETETLTISSGDKTHSFNVEIADTDAKQAQGLMFRSTLSPDAGMLFEFGAPKVATIWMQNTEISLDILFVLKDGRVVKIEHGAQPESKRSASSEVVVAAVLELPAGRAQELGITPGDIVTHSFFAEE